jgi:hypothetical protein
MFHYEFATMIRVHPEGAVIVNELIGFPLVLAIVTLFPSVIEIAALLSPATTASPVTDPAVEVVH